MEHCDLEGECATPCPSARCYLVHVAAVAYDPVEACLLACGATVATSLDGRGRHQHHWEACRRDGGHWVHQIHLKHMAAEHGQNST